MRKISQEASPGADWRDELAVVADELPPSPSVLSADGVEESPLASLPDSCREKKMPLLHLTFLFRSKKSKPDVFFFVLSAHPSRFLQPNIAEILGLEFYQGFGLKTGLPYLHLRTP